jgi:NAD(P)-dependent dehydrogenase (short-subunit alcohol dehydrogenase family)
MERRVAVIVGAGPGLGWSLGRRFARSGMHTVLAARDLDRLKNLLTSHRGDDSAPGSFEPRTCDAADASQVTSLFAALASRGDVPAVVVFNAGTFFPAAVLDITPETFERCWRIGCLGGFLVGQAAARLMLGSGTGDVSESHSSDHGNSNSNSNGTIIFTGATASLRGSAEFANLAVPKFGLRALTQSMAREWGPKNIHVAHVVIDGQIESERYRQLGAKRGPDALLSPDAIAETFYQLHLQPRSAWTHELDLRPWSEKF